MVATVRGREQTTERGSPNGVSSAEMREVLETLRSHYQERLHRKSDDFAATQELRSVERALAMLPRVDADRF